MCSIETKCLYENAARGRTVPFLKKLYVISFNEMISESYLDLVKIVNVIEG
jgi:hypothetical protein